MAVNTERLERYLASSGSAKVERTPPTEQLERQLHRKVLGHDADGVVKLTADGGPTDDAVRALRSTLEHFVDTAAVLGAPSDTYRRLAARRTSEPVAAQVMAECVAAYRLVLGREPDDAGFDEFVRLRHQHSLAVVTGALLGSAEAVAHFAPYEPPPVGSTSVTVAATAVTVLAAAASDATYATALATRTRLADTAARVKDLAHAIDDLAMLVKVRLDGAAAQR